MLAGVDKNTLAYRDEDGDIIGLVNSGNRPSPGKIGRLWFEQFPYPRLSYDTGRSWVELDGIRKIEELVYLDLDRKRIGILNKLPQYTVDVKGAVNVSEYFATTATTNTFIAKTDTIKVYMTKSGISPTKTLVWKALTEDGIEMILSSLVI